MLQFWSVLNPETQVVEKWIYAKQKIPQDAFLSIYEIKQLDGSQVNS